MTLYDKLTLAAYGLFFLGLLIDADKMTTAK
jgi:hypothetical protein